MIGVVACLVVLKFNKQVISFGPGHHANHSLHNFILLYNIDYDNIVNNIMPLSYYNMHDI